jgi:glutamate transport system substrate-binding protein
VGSLRTARAIDGGTTAVDAHTRRGTMKSITKIIGATAGAALTLTMTACVQEENAAPAGAASSGGPVTIGIKYDQPGLGQQVGNDYEGFDVEVARYVAKELGYTDVTFKESQVKMIFATYSITDERKQKVSFGGPYFIAGQDLLVKSDNTDITGPESLNGKKLCSVTGSTSAQKIKTNLATGVQLQEFDTYSKCVQALNSGTIDAVTTDNVILAGFAAQSQYQGKLKVVGKPFSEERYGVGIKQGDTALCESVNTAIQKMVDEGAWQKALDDTVGPSGFKLDTTTNPPKPDPCA